MIAQESQAIAAGSAQAVNYPYDKAGNRLTLRRDGDGITAAYAYDSRDRCTKVRDYNGSAWVGLADYTWLGNALNRRDTTCDYPGNTKPKFKTEFQRDGIGRVTKVVNQHLTLDQGTSGCNELGTFEYTYDVNSNVVTAPQFSHSGRVPSATSQAAGVEHGVAQRYSVVTGSEGRVDEREPRISQPEVPGAVLR